MELLGFGQHPLDHHCCLSRRGLFELSCGWVYILLGIPIVGRWALGTARLIPGCGMDTRGMDGLSRE